MDTDYLFIDFFIFYFLFNNFSLTKFVESTPDPLIPAKAPSEGNPWTDKTRSGLPPCLLL